MADTLDYLKQPHYYLQYVQYTVQGSSIYLHNISPRAYDTYWYIKCASLSKSDFLDDSNRELQTDAEFISAHS